MWSKTSHDFGDQPEGQILKTSFHYSGNKVVRNIIPSCECTSWKRDYKTLTEFTLDILWKIRVKRRERDIGTYLTIEYTDGSIDDLEMKTHVIINNT